MEIVGTIRVMMLRLGIQQPPLLPSLGLLVQTKQEKNPRRDCLGTDKRYKLSRSIIGQAHVDQENAEGGHRHAHVW